MFFFLPDCLIPRCYQGVKRRYWNECISLTLIFIFGVSCSLFMENPGDGLISGEFWNKFRILVHGPLMCPFCGASRSFVFMCRGDFLQALHYSIFGTYFFVACIFHGIAKFILLKYEPPQKFVRFIDFLDRKFPVTVLLFVIWGIQLALHYSGIFLWYTTR